MARHFGHGPRRAVALHCALAHGGAWAGVGAALADDFTITAPDLPGHGRGVPWPSYDGDYLAAVLEVANAAVADQDGPVDLIGHSFGGVVALAMALSDRSRIRSLTLIEPVLFAAAPPGSDTTNAEPGEPFRQLILSGDLPGAAEYFHNRWGGEPSWTDMKPARRNRFAAMIHLVAAQHPTVTHDAGNILLPGRLEALSLPVLLIRGEKSPPVVPAICDALAARLPDARRVSIPGAGHMVPITHPAEVSGLIREQVAAHA